MVGPRRVPGVWPRDGGATVGGIARPAGVAHAGRILPATVAVGAGPTRLEGLESSDRGDAMTGEHLVAPSVCEHAPMGVYEHQILPRVIDLLLGNAQMAKVRRPALEGLHGTVLEIGFGSGPNVTLYPPAVDKVVAVDPATVGRRLAVKRLEASTVPVEFVGLDGQDLPLDDASVDCVLSTWTLCTIPDVAAALAEASRVLRDDGRLFFLEHGLSPDPGVAAWQRRLNPIQKKVAGGCHLDRDIPALVRDAGFVTERLAEFDIAGPKPMSHMFSGVAAKAG